MNKSTLLKLAHKIKKLFHLINRYFFILPVLAKISRMLSDFNLLTDNKKRLFKNIYFLLEIFIIIKILVCFSIVLWMTDFVNPINLTYNLYNDLLGEYINFIVNIYNHLLNLINHYFNVLYESITGSVKDSVIKDQLSSPSIQEEIKSGVKDGIKQAFKELSDDLDQKTYSIKSDYFADKATQFFIVAGAAFVIYFIFVLPGSTENLVEYNTINQSLINFKVSILDLFTKPGNPGNPGTPIVPNTNNSSPIIPINELEDSLRPISRTLSDSSTSSEDTIRSFMSATRGDRMIPRLSPTLSESSNVTITNIPTLAQYLEASTQVNPLTTDASTQTVLESITVTKVNTANTIMMKSLGESNVQLIVDEVNNMVTNITD
jgi:hypothetical protein